jgi:hypothetical protein
MSVDAVQVVGVATCYVYRLNVLPGAAALPSSVA